MLSGGTLINEVNLTLDLFVCHGFHMTTQEKLKIGTEGEFPSMPLGVIRWDFDEMTFPLLKETDWILTEHNGSVVPSWATSDWRRNRSSEGR